MLCVSGHVLSSAPQEAGNTNTLHLKCRIEQEREYVLLFSASGHRTAITHELPYGQYEITGNSLLEYWKTMCFVMSRESLFSNIQVMFEIK